MLTDVAESRAFLDINLLIYYAKEK